MLLRFLIAVLIFMLPFIIFISLFAISGKNRSAWKVLKVLFKENMPKYHLLFLFQCGLLGWITVWMLVLVVYYKTICAVVKYFTGAGRRASRLFDRAEDIYDNLTKPFGIKVL